jgi:hypothetical protein
MGRGAEEKRRSPEKGGCMGCGYRIALTERNWGALVLGIDIHNDTECTRLYEASLHKFN